MRLKVRKKTAAITAGAALATIGVMGTVIAMSSGPVGADDTRVPAVAGGADTQAQPEDGPAVTAARAEQIARQEIQGSRVVSVQLESDGGRSEWEVEVITAVGERRDVRIDAAAGRVLSNRPDDGTDDCECEDDEGAAKGESSGQSGGKGAPGGKGGDDRAGDGGANDADDGGDDDGGDDDGDDDGGDDDGGDD